LLLAECYITEPLSGDINHSAPKSPFDCISEWEFHASIQTFSNSFEFVTEQYVQKPKQVKTIEMQLLVFKRRIISVPTYKL